jgi:release factor glutamine methyltransferase
MTRSSGWNRRGISIWVENDDNLNLTEEASMTPPAASEQTWTVGSLLNWTASFLAQKQCESPRIDTEVLLAHVLDCQRIDLYGIRHGEQASDDVRQRYRELIRKRIEGCPVAYLVGRKEFFSLVFEVSPAVLIPRPDSEVAVMECLAIAKPLASLRVLDIGTGSGNLAVALARHHPGAQVTAVDISADALQIAGRNAESHGVAGRVTFLQGDMFAPLTASEPFDVVISNPPYIPTADMPRLPVGVRDFEPRQALDGGTSGFEVFERLITGACQHLRQGGWLIVEIGAPQESEARRRLEAVGSYELLPTVRDFSGHPRVVKARRVG